jgi:hypothetical protein
MSSGVELVYGVNGQQAPRCSKREEVERWANSREGRDGNGAVDSEASGTQSGHRTLAEMTSKRLPPLSIPRYCIIRYNLDKSDIIFFYFYTMTQQKTTILSASHRAVMLGTLESRHQKVMMLLWR